LLKVAFVASTIAFLYSVFQFLTGRVLHRSLALMPIDEHMYRAVGFYGAALSFAAYGLVIFFLSASFLSGRTERERLRWLPIPVLAFLGLFSTFARSVWLSAFAIIPFLGFTKSRRAGWRMLAILAVGISLTSLAVPQIRDRIASIFTTTGNETRIHLWKSTLRIVEAYPFFGVGQDNFDYHFPLFRVEGFYDATDHPHNDYLNVLVGGGVPAGLAFVAMWVLVLWRGWSAMQRKTEAILHSTAVGATLSLAGLLIGSSFQNYYGTFVNCWLWWFVVGYSPTRSPVLRSIQSRTRSRIDCRNSSSRYSKIQCSAATRSCITAGCVPSNILSRPPF
jgi:O-antigen ligase